MTKGQMPSPLSHTILIEQLPLNILLASTDLYNKVFKLVSNETQEACLLFIVDLFTYKFSF